MKLYYPCSENKGAHLRLCFRIGEIPVFSRCGSFEYEQNITFMKMLWLKAAFHFFLLGTDNTVAMGCYGCTDVETAALTIVKGRHKLQKLAHGIYREFVSKAKLENFIGKVLLFFLIFAQNIDCGYTLEPPRRTHNWLEPTISVFWSKYKNRFTLVQSNFTI